MEFIDFFLELRSVGREVAESRVLGDGLPASGGEILVDGALWDGVAIARGTSNSTWRMSLSGADLPAVRKLCGLKGHSAQRKLFKMFLSIFQVVLERKWTTFALTETCSHHAIRESHRIHAEMVWKSSTQSNYEALATKYGVYYSSLLQLEHFDAVRFIAIDPMNNLFLGTPKNVFKLWIKKMCYQKKILKS